MKSKHTHNSCDLITTNSIRVFRNYNKNTNFVNKHWLKTSTLLPPIRRELSACSNCGTQLFKHSTRRMNYDRFVCMYIVILWQIFHCPWSRHVTAIKKVFTHEQCCELFLFLLISFSLNFISMTNGRHLLNQVITEHEDL